MFVVFEGIDGSGKTTVSNLVVERLRARGLSVKHLRAEGKFASVVSESIRSLARDSKHIDLVPRAEFLLYVARDVQLMDELMADALRTHDVVVADRFLYTAEVLARFGRALPKSYVEPVLSAAAAGLSPDLVVLVDVDPVLARARRKASKLINQDPRPPSRKGLSGVGLSHRLRRGYLELAAADAERWVVLKNEAVLEQAVGRVSDLISGAVREGARHAIARFRAEDEGKERSVRALSTPQDALAKLLEWLHARAQPEPQVAAYVLSGLSGPEIDDLRRSLAHKVPNVILSGLSGLADEVSWELRAELVRDRPHAVARSIGGRVALDPRAAVLRESLLAIAPADVIKSMTQLQDEASFALRERLFEAQAEAVMNSIAGHDSERAWALRHAYLKRNEKRLSDEYEVARAVAKSVQGLGSDEAFELRERASQAAPLSSLSALAGLCCERSFAQRARYLRRAPKLVMESLHRISAPLAWEMRRETVREIKEAVDSIAELDDEEAWQLREDYADLWPSTVVKSLGLLADGERGEQLIRRQLSRHAENVSLLKHAAAVALHAHHVSLAGGPARFDSPDLEE